MASKDRAYTDIDSITLLDENNSFIIKHNDDIGDLTNVTKDLEKLGINITHHLSSININRNRNLFSNNNNNNNLLVSGEIEEKNGQINNNNNNDGFDGFNLPPQSQLQKENKELKSQIFDLKKDINEIRQVLRQQTLQQEPLQHYLIII